MCTQDEQVLIEKIATKLAYDFSSRYAYTGNGAMNWFEDFKSEAIVAALELLPSYDSSKSEASLSTYLYKNVNLTLKKYVDRVMPAFKGSIPDAAEEDRVQLMHGGVSLDTDLTDEEGEGNETIASKVAGCKGAEHEYLSSEEAMFHNIERILKNERDITLVKLIVFEDKTIKEAAEILGISYQGAKQLKENLFAKLRAEYSNHN